MLWTRQDPRAFMKSLDYTVVVDGRILTAADSGWLVTPGVWNEEYGSGYLVRVHKETGLRVASCVKCFPGGAVSVWVEVENGGTAVLTLERVDSIRLHLPPNAYHLRSYAGEGMREFQPRDAALSGPMTLDTRSGRSSNGAHPWFGLKDADGRILCAAIAWPGNHIVRFEEDEGGWTVTGGLNDWNFSTTLVPGESFIAPEVLLAEADGGDWDAAARAFHRWGREAGYPRTPLARALPVEWNHWWPYDDTAINEQVFRANTEAAVRMGIEAVTLDAGWFGRPGPTHWVDVRGDWDAVNTERFPSGIRALSDHAHSQGLKFGLWCEIEAVGPNADLAERHPEYLALREGNSIGTVCFGNPAARRWAEETLDRLITDYACDWIKIDFNVDPGAGCNRTDHGHGEGDGLYRHILGLWDIVESLRTKYPEVLFEACASGGLRLDLGTLKHFPCAYISDPDYPAHSLQVFWGALDYIAPQACLHWAFSETTAGWDSFRPSDPSLTMEQVDYYCRIGMLGFFGFSQKLPDLPQRVFDRFARHTRVYRERVAPFVREADVYRLTGQPLRDGGGDRWAAFQYVLPGAGSAALVAFRLPGGEESRTLRLRGLDPERAYRLEWDGTDRTEESTGADLMERGITFSDLPEEGSALVFLAS